MAWARATHEYNYEKIKGKKTKAGNSLTIINYRFRRQAFGIDDHAEIKCSTV